MFTTSGTYPWSFVTQIFHNGQPSHGGDRKIFEVMTSTLPKGTLGSVASLLAELYKYIAYYFLSPNKSVFDSYWVLFCATLVMTFDDFLYFSTSAVYNVHFSICTYLYFYT